MLTLAYIASRLDHEIAELESFGPGGTPSDINHHVWCARLAELRQVRRWLLEEPESIADAQRLYEHHRAEAERLREQIADMTRDAVVRVAKAAGWGCES